MNGIVFDLEATCEDRKIVSSFDNETIEIGAVKVIDGLVVDEFSAFIKPKYTQITPFCTELTSITKSDVENANGFEEVIEEFKKWCDGLTLLSWGFYDRKQLEKDCNRYGIEDINWLENHRSIKHEYGDIKGLRRPVGVQKALMTEGMSFEGTHHRGIDDAKNIARIYLKAFNN